MTPYPETHTGTSGRRIVRVGSLQALLGAALVWLPFAIAAQPTGLLLSGAALAVTGVLLALLAGLGGRATHAGSPPAAARFAALRDRARRVGVLRQRDPDAAGRSRPRAPTALLAAA